MKKKILASLIAMFLILPAVVNAESIPIINEQSSVVGDDGVVTNTIDFSFDFSKVADDFKLELTSSDTLKFTMKKGADVSYSGVKSTENFDVVRNGDILEVTLKEDLLSKEFTKDSGSVQFATVSISYKEGTDCSLTIEGSYIESTPVVTPNVQTGINVPLVALGAAGALAVGIYLTVGKKNKIYNV